MIEQAKPDHLQWSGRLEVLRRRINDEDYLYAAIQRLALVLSNELMEITPHRRCASSSMREGGYHGRQRKRQK